jgi:hypothetical protein
MEKFSNLFTVLKNASPTQKAYAALVLIALIPVAILLVTILGSGSGDPSAVREGGSVSLFDSDFWLSGNAKSEELELGPDFALLLDEINPRTGRNFTEEEARKAQYLASRFPENELLPRPDIPGYNEILAERARAQEERGFAVAGGEGTRADIESYYGRIQKIYGDQVELLEYALEFEEIPEEYEVRMRKMLVHSREVLAQLKEQKENSLAILERRLAEGDQ